jgi:hypothetical protein
MGDKYNHTFFNQRRAFVEEFPTCISPNNTPDHATYTAGRDHGVSLRVRRTSSEFARKEG